MAPATCPWPPYLCATHTPCSAIRPRIMDKHLATLAKKYFDTRFIKISAPVCVMELALLLLPPCSSMFSAGCGHQAAGLGDAAVECVA